MTRRLHTCVMRADPVVFTICRLREEDELQFLDRCARENIVLVHRRTQLQPYTPTRRVEKLEDVDDRRS